MSRMDRIVFKYPISLFVYGPEDPETPLEKLTFGANEVLDCWVDHKDGETTTLEYRPVHKIYLPDGRELHDVPYTAFRWEPGAPPETVT